MIDFARMAERRAARERMPEQQFNYACRACGHVTAYSDELPEHLLQHRCEQYVERVPGDGDFRRCPGRAIVRVGCQCEKCRTGAASAAYSPSPIDGSATNEKNMSDNNPLLSNSEADAINEFLNHRGMDGGGKRLGNWIENGSLVTWNHTARRPREIWRHRVPVVDVRTDKETKVSENVIFGRDWGCIEDEAVLKKQYKRDRKTNQRLLLPRACPLCLLIEWVHVMVIEGKLSWTDPVLRYEGKDWVQQRNGKSMLVDSERIIHAAGLYNGYKDADDEQKKELEQHGIFVSDAWRENAQAKLGYLFFIVDAANVGDGVQVTVQTQAVGDAVKAVIGDQMAMHARSKPPNPDLGNPLKHPYAIEWLYRKDEKNFSDKYHARWLDPRIEPMTEEIRRLIIDEPVPDAGYIAEPLNPVALRAMLEQHWCAPIDLPVKQLFAGTSAAPRSPAPPAAKPAAPPPPPAPRRSAVEDAHEKAIASAAAKATTEDRSSVEAPAQRTGRRRVATPPPPPKSEMGDPCDTCKAPMVKDAMKCDACGTTYTDDDGDSVPFDN